MLLFTHSAQAQGPALSQAQDTLASSEQAIRSISKPRRLITSNELETFRDTFFAGQIEQWHIPGAVVVVVKDGQILFTKGYGYANLEEQIPVTPDKTIFQVGSISKLFTATAIMQLSEQGLLTLDDDVNNHLHSLQIKDTNPSPVTIAKLLTHTSGLEERFIGTAVRNESDLLPLGQYLSARMPLRTLASDNIISYSNHNYTLAGHLVEEVSGLPFPQYIEENILHPLNMHHSSFERPEYLKPNLAMGYEYKDGDHHLISKNYYYNITPAGSFVTTGSDMAHFMIAHLQEGRYKNTRILSESTTQKMHRQHYTHHPQCNRSPPLSKKNTKSRFLPMKAGLCI